MAETEFARLLRDARVNAALGWVVTGVVALVAVGEFLAADYLWGSFALVVVVLIVIPPVAFLSKRTMLPWEVLLLASLPVIGRTFATFDLSNRIATYLSVAALALIIAVELQVFTTVKMTATFAVAFVAMTTMAVAGVWAWVRWAADIWLGTGLLETLGHDEEEIERAIMLEFVASFIAGIVAGFVFEFYIRRRARIDPRIPDDVRGKS